MKQLSRSILASTGFLVVSVAACSSEPGSPSNNGGSAPGAAGVAQAGASAGTGASAGSSASAGTSSGGQTAGAAGGAGVSGSASGSGGAGGSAVGGNAGVGGTGGVAVDAGLVVSPSELVFGAVQQVQSPSQTLTLKNPSSVAVQLGSAVLDPAAPGTATFELVSGPAAGAEIAAGASATVQIRFRPSGINTFQSKLVIETKTPAKKLEVGLFGLGTKGLEGENEPFLKPVLDTLGFDINVGGPGLLSTTTPLVGDEVAAPRFKAASAAEIDLIPVARYSPQEPIPYGYYSGATETVVGTISNDQYQALNPKTDAGSKLSFAAPAGEFGIFTTSKTHKSYSEDSKNAANATKHAVRTYPLKDRAGKAIPSSYLVCFEEAANGDYQDYVFTLSNVVPVAP